MKGILSLSLYQADLILRNVSMEEVKRRHSVSHRHSCLLYASELDIEVLLFW